MTSPLRGGNDGGCAAMILDSAWLTVCFWFLVMTCCGNSSFDIFQNHRFGECVMRTIAPRRTRHAALLRLAHGRPPQHAPAHPTESRLNPAS
ncbi:MAG: hypothetical protein WCZ18_07900 [Ottowia sp.]|nr:hypothetical protein [Ottowia sp.]